MSETLRESINRFVKTLVEKKHIVRWYDLSMMDDENDLQLRAFNF